MLIGCFQDVAEKKLGLSIGRQDQSVLINVSVGKCNCFCVNTVEIV